MVTRNGILLLVALIFSPILCFAAPELSLEVEPRRGTTSDRYVFSVTVIGDSGGTTPTLSGGDDFELQFLGPQSRIQIINGAVSQEVTYIYQLTPKKEGKLETPSAELLVNGQPLTAAPLSVTVKKSTQKNTAKSSSLFLQQRIDNYTPYIGEQVINTIELFSQNNLVQAKFSDFTFDGFWGEAIGKEESFLRNFGGKRYKINQVQQALFPLRSGKLPIMPREVIAVVRVRERNPLGRFGMFDHDFFGLSRTERRRIRSEEIVLNVRPLPPVPADLKQHQQKTVPTGKTSLSLRTDNTPIDIGESKTVTVEVRSFGNINPLTGLTLPKNRSVKIYDETPDIDGEELDGRLLTVKTFRFSIIPIEAGTIEIPPFQVLYFDPADARYHLATTEPVTIPVTGTTTDRYHTEKQAVGNQSTPSDPTKPPPVPLENEQPQPTYQPESALERLSQQISLSLSLLVLTIVALLTLLVTVLARVIAKQRKDRQLEATLRNAATPSELSERFLTYATHLVGESTSSGTKSELLTLIGDDPTRESIRYAVQSLFDDIGSMLYGGREISTREMEKTREKALEVTELLRNFRSPHIPAANEDARFLEHRLAKKRKGPDRPL